MAFLQWRKFQFFESSFLKDTELNELLLCSQSQSGVTPAPITCSTSGRGVVIIGDANGFVHIINKQQNVRLFKANQRTTSHIKQIPRQPFLITCGADTEGINPLIKIWNLDKMDRMNQPTCTRVIRANSGFLQPSNVTCFDCNDSMTLLIVGYQNGQIVIFRGDVSRQRYSKSNKPVEISQHPITGISIREDPHQHDKPVLTGIQSYLYQNSAKDKDSSAFIATVEEIFFLEVTDKSYSKFQIDTIGSKPKCCCLMNDAKNLSDSLFAVGRDNAVYFYQTDGRGPCLAFEGKKLILHKFKNYLVVVSQDKSSQSLEMEFGNRRSSTDQTERDLIKMVNLNIYDIQNKYIAHTSIVPEVLEIFSEWGILYLICTNGQLLVFQERDTQTKLEALFTRNQFGLAIDIAKSHLYTDDALADIFKQYGDHLYKKGDYDAAITQYIKTIGHSEPSYVIKKFLDSQRIHNLTGYLEALHKKSFAKQDHTKLLLNCYSKLKNENQLKEFIESYEKGNIEFNLETAIKVLRDAGFHEIAIYLAKQHKNHEWYFKVQMEDGGDVLSALEYMRSMNNLDEMALYMRKYGRSMLKEEPDQTIDIIKNICLKSHENKSLSVHSQNSQEEMSVHSNYKIYPEEFFHIFVDNNELFVKLLEQIVTDEFGSEFATKGVHNLLLELYLHSWRKQNDDYLMKNLTSEKIMKLLLKPDDSYDLEQAMILCRSNNFLEGLLHLYKRAKLYNLILQYYIDQNDSVKIMKTCEQNGEEDPSLYISALMHYSKTGDKRLTQILNSIEHKKLLPPTMVIDMLLEGDQNQLGTIKDYILRVLGRDYEKIIDNERLIDHYEDDTEKIRLQIEELENHLRVFQPSKCAACGNGLDIPSVHFLCSHSYHQICFHSYSAENDECPICITNNKKLLGAIESHESMRMTLDKLEQQLVTSSEDTFNVVAKFFSYGLIKNDVHD